MPDGVWKAGARVAKEPDNKQVDWEDEDGALDA